VSVGHERAQRPGKPDPPAQASAATSEPASGALTPSERLAFRQARTVGRGEPLEPDAARSLAGRFGFALAAVRVHVDAEAARTAGARAYTFGTHIVFGRGEYEPQTSRGRALLAHELTHVAQQLSGDRGSEESQEREAAAAEAGGPFPARPRGRLLPVVRMRPGDAVSVTIDTGRNGAEFRVELESGDVVTGTGRLINLAPGEYRVRASHGRSVVTRIDGSALPRSAHFEVPPTPGNAALVRVLAAAGRAIPLYVRDADAAAAQTRGAEETDRHDDAEGGDARRRAIEALPDRVRRFLFHAGGPPTSPSDYPTLLRIAGRIQNLSDEDLDEFRAGSTGRTTNVGAFEASVNRWLAAREARRHAESAEADAARRLQGLDAVYARYRSWRFGLQFGVDPDPIGRWEALPVSALPQHAEGSMLEGYLQLRRAVAQHGFPTLGLFETQIERFVSAFRESAFHLGLDLLARSEAQLIRERERYRNEGIAPLHARLAPARSTFAQADAYQRAAQAQLGGMSPTSVGAYYAAGGRYQELIEHGRSQATALATADPLLARRDFPQDEIGRADPAETAQIIERYVAESLDHIHDTRERLAADHELVFRINPLLARVRARLGIEPGSLRAQILADQRLPTIDDAVRERLTTVFTIALLVLSGGSLAAAAASFGVSAYLALQEYEDYAFQADAYGAQLLTEEPTLTWVVIAVVGAGMDAAAVAPFIRALRPALREFEATGDIARLEARLGGAERRIREAVISRAHIEARARRGWQGFLPRTGLRASVFFLDHVAEMFGWFVYSVHINLRRAVNTFERWAASSEAIDLIGRLDEMTPGQVETMRGLYTAGVRDAQRVAEHGLSLGMTDAEIDAELLAWANRGSGTADDVMQEMTRSRTRPAVTAPTPSETTPADAVPGASPAPASAVAEPVTSPLAAPPSQTVPVLDPTAAAAAQRRVGELDAQRAALVTSLQTANEELENLEGRIRELRRLADEVAHGGREPAGLLQRLTDEERAWVSAQRRLRRPQTSAVEDVLRQRVRRLEQRAAEARQRHEALRATDRRLFAEADRLRYLGQFRLPRVSGGRYRTVRDATHTLGGQVNHIPAQASYDGYIQLHVDDGPAIWMTTEDHRLTASYGNAVSWHTRQRTLILQGRFRDAVQMDIDDIRRHFGDRYNPAIEQLLIEVDRLLRVDPDLVRPRSVR
jgi:hypothetical protein